MLVNGKLIKQGIVIVQGKLCTQHWLTSSAHAASTFSALIRNDSGNQIEGWEAFGTWHIALTSSVAVGTLWSCSQRVTSASKASICPLLDSWHAADFRSYCDIYIILPWGHTSQRETRQSKGLHHVSEDQRGKSLILYHKQQKAWWNNTWSEHMSKKYRSSICCLLWSLLSVGCTESLACVASIAGHWHIAVALSSWMPKTYLPENSTYERPMNSIAKEAKQ